ncbi:M48 family metallopeptidase [Limnohabitans lacus]|uniref:SprT family zinc-dependent metalloprotease n=1 Tax=Limnohabitans lacus TaxID=3045173 RepID=A0ABT6XAD3_9BURK|nr:SprT family zinc-dependent metalloprotease [Limnohabitans sp. HM2-2]MDI9235036.1 SprT family zinc-dependent metalloprotease [Limnohabitans sp. HM2-2]
MRAPLQFVLDFFTGGDPVLPAPHKAAPTDLAGAVANLPPSAEPRAAPQAKPPSDLTPPQALPEPSGFSHPAANRHAVLHGMTVSFLFERSRRRTIGFMVGAEGLVVRAPSWVTLREVDAAVQEKGAWIVAKLQQTRQRQTEQFQQAIEWTHGAHVPFLGGTVQLCVLERGTPQAAAADVQRLPVSVPPGASATQVREVAEAWLKKQARTLFEQRLQHFAPLLGVQWRKLSLSSASTRWGSARSDGHIRLNWRLIHLPVSQIDYVVVHELAHLREMNHSPRFWETVGEVMPDYAQRRKALKESPVGLAQD